MSIIQIDRDNIDREHVCCAIGNDKENAARARTKKEWMARQFEHGLRFKRLDARGKVFIEYMPVESVWKPVIGNNLFVINCLWVSGQYKGKGHSTSLLEECKTDAIAHGKYGIAVVTSTKVKPFLTDKRFYLKHGFEVVDSAYPYFDLLLLRLSESAGLPRFTDAVKNGTCAYKDGFSFIYSNQCPFMEEYVGMLSRVVASLNFKYTIHKLRNHEDARRHGSAFGTLGIYYNGSFLTHELMTEARFRALILERCV